MARRARPERSRRREEGFTFLWLIFALAVVAAGLAAIAQPISLAAQRDREAELMFRGSQIARALSSYWAATPGEVKQLPRSLADLVEDRRGARPLRHLRRIYADPFTGSPDWVLVTDDDGRITSVHSRSTATALRVVDLPRATDAAAVPVSARLFRFVPVSPASSASAPEPIPSSALRSPPIGGSAPSP
jgi:type II secretory pathway pseudopilin PulG